VDTQTARRCAEAFARIKGDLDGPALVLALRVAVRLRDIERLQRPEIEIVWTGPDAEGPLVRPTAAVIEEMLRGVREAGEVLVVGYSLTADDGSSMAAIIDLLGEASRRRAVVTMILHRDEEARNRSNLLAAWDERAIKPRLFTWNPPKDFPYTKLHAKALVVDRLEALVTSANLTLHGLEANLELGLRVRGPQAQSIALRFDHLIASNVLHEWSGS
jgi:phosphatidylserine/phosphatidylglycerophosphate/cardiolipin synthase-like enzyme